MSRNGTILYIGGFELPDKNAAAHLALNNAKIFNRLGYKVIFCGVNKELQFGVKDYSEHIEGYDSFPKPYPKNLVEWMKDFWSIRNYKRVLEKNSDVNFVVAYNVHSFQTMKMLKYCRKNGIYFISNTTEWYENKFSINPIKFMKFLDTLLVMRVLNKKADGIITNSSYIEKYYHNCIGNILVMPPLVDVRDNKWRGHSYKHGDKIRFIYSGSPEINGTKDKLLPIIRCFEKVSNYNFVFSVLGVTKEQFLLQHREMTECLERLKKKIVFYGRVSHAESIAKLFDSDFSIFIRDSTRKNNAGFPTKFVEGYTSGINIIASNISDVKDYFPKDDYSILLNNNTEETILDALRKSLELDSSDIEKRRRNGLSDNPFDYRKWVERVQVFFSHFK